MAKNNVFFVEVYFFIINFKYCYKLATNSNYNKAVPP